MAKTEFINNYQDLDDLDLEQIASQVKGGYSSGHLSNGEAKKFTGNSKLMYGKKNKVYTYYKI